MTDAALAEPKTNGNGHSQREAEIASYLAKQSTERDALAIENTQLKAARTGDAVKIDELEALLAEAKSRCETAMIIRDEAVARRAQVETVLEGMMALGRAFQISNAPLVQPREAPEDIAAIGGA